MIIIAIYTTGLILTFALLMLTLGRIFPRSWQWYSCLAVSAVWFAFWPYALLKRDC